MTDSNQAPEIDAVEVQGRRYYIGDRGTYQTAWGIVRHAEVSRADDTEIQGFDELYSVKTEVFGLDRAAIEVHPRKERLVVDQPTRHLWVLPEQTDPPFGIHRDDQMDDRVDDRKDNQPAVKTLGPGKFQTDGNQPIDDHAARLKEAAGDCPECGQEAFRMRGLLRHVMDEPATAVCENDHEWDVSLPDEGDT